MAEANNLNIYKYLKFLLEQRPNSKMSDEQHSVILQWNQEVIDNDSDCMCYVTGKITKELYKNQQELGDEEFCKYIRTCLMKKKTN